MSRSALVAACAAVIAVIGSIIAWQTDPPPAANAASASSGVRGGADLFAAKGCATCHTGPDSRASFDAFPSLASAPSWAGERRAGLTDREYLTESIRSPSAFISPAFDSGGGPTTQMPDLGLSDTEIDALVTYLLDG